MCVGKHLGFVVMAPALSSKILSLAERLQLQLVYLVVHFMPAWITTLEKYVKFLHKLIHAMSKHKMYGGFWVISDYTSNKSKALGQLNKAIIR